MAITKAQCELLPSGTPYAGSALAVRPGSAGAQGVRITYAAPPFTSHVLEPLAAIVGTALAGTLEYWMRNNGSTYFGPFIRAASPFALTQKMILSYHGSGLETVAMLIGGFSNTQYVQPTLISGWLQRRVKYSDIAPGGVRMRLEAYDGVLAMWVLQHHITFARTGDGYGAAGRTGFFGLSSGGYTDIDDFSHDTTVPPSFPSADLYQGAVNEGFETAAWRENAGIYAFSGSGETLTLVTDNRPSSAGTKALEVAYSGSFLLSTLRIPYMVWQNPTAPKATEMTVWYKMPSSFAASQTYYVSASSLGGLSDPNRPYYLKMVVDGSGNATITAHNRVETAVGSDVEFTVADTVAVDTWVGLKFRVRPGSGQVAPKLYAAWANNSPTFAHLNGAVEWTANRVRSRAQYNGALSRIDLIDLLEGDTAIGETFTLGGCTNPANNGTYTITSLAIGGDHSLVGITPSLTDTNVGASAYADIDDVFHKGAPPLAGISYVSSSAAGSYRVDDAKLEQIT